MRTVPCYRGMQLALYPDGSAKILQDSDYENGISPEADVVSVVDFDLDWSKCNGSACELCKGWEPPPIPTTIPGVRLSEQQA